MQIKNNGKTLRELQEKTLDLDVRCKQLEQTAALEQRTNNRFKEIEKMFVQVDYAFEDIKNQMATTDTFIDHYMPHKINKMTIKMLKQLYQCGSQDSNDDEQRDILLNKIEEQ